MVQRIRYVRSRKSSTTAAGRSDGTNLPFDTYYGNADFLKR